jgi:ankyrin repeat protein
MKSVVKFVLVFCLLLLIKASSLQAGNIHDAAKSGDLNKVKAILSSDTTSLDSKDENGFTPLARVCMTRPCSSHHLLVANFLIDKGANVNAKFNNGFTPFLLACERMDPDFDLIQNFITHGADVKMQVGGGRTALQMITLSGNLKIMKLLIDHGADINAQDKELGSALHMAINSRKLDVAKFLIESGASLNMKISYGYTEIHLVALSGLASLVRTLVEHGANINALNEYNHTALYYATKHGYRATADSLIALGADKNTIVETNYGKAPQLTSPLQNGEAYIWYLGGFIGAGYAVKTRDRLP